MKNEQTKKSSWKRSLLKYFLVILLFAVGYLTYYFFIGIPKTQARNLYEISQEHLNMGETDKYIEKLNEAYSRWPEKYIADELETFSQVAK